MTTRINWTIAIALMCFVCNAFSAVVIPCPEMPLAVTTINHDVKSDIAATAGSLGKIKAAEVAVKTEVAANNLFGKYPNVDKLVTLQMMAATYCAMLQSSSLGDTDKLDRWEKFQNRVLMLEPPAKASASLPSTVPSQTPIKAPSSTSNHKEPTIATKPMIAQPERREDCVRRVGTKRKECLNQCEKTANRYLEQNWGDVITKASTSTGRVQETYEGMLLKEKEKKYGPCAYACEDTHSESVCN